MAQELIYTSVTRGLRPGTSGYTTVAHTGGLPAALAARLEGLSGYRHLTVGDDPAVSGNPVRYAHAVLGGGGTGVHVLSRVADAGLDHTGRSNLLAHHLALDPAELAPAGPAWVCGQSGLFETVWDRSPELIPRARSIPSGTAKARVCKGWAAATGDAGWGGVLAAATDPSAPGYVVYPAGEDVLPLFAEALALLPPEARWRVTFNTYFTGAQAGVEYQWRGVVAGSPEARTALDERRGVIIRLDQPMAGSPTGPLVEGARTGVVAEPVAPAPTPRPRAVEGILEPPRSSRRRPRTPTPGGFTVVDPHATDLPPDDLPDDVPEEYVAAEPRPAAGGGAVRPLLVGLALGMLVFLIASTLVELAAQKSLLALVGLTGKDEPTPPKEPDELRTAKAELGTARADLLAATKRVEDLNTQLRSQRGKDDDHAAARKTWNDERTALKTENEELKGKLAEAIKKAGTPTVKVPTPIEKKGNMTDPPVGPKNPPVAAGKAELRVVKTEFDPNSAVVELNGHPGVPVTGIKVCGLKDAEGWKRVEKTETGVTVHRLDLTAKLEKTATGSVTLDIKKAGDYPLLGMAVIKLESKGQDIHWQLFSAQAVTKRERLSEIPERLEKSFRYTLDIGQLLPGKDAAGKALKKEVETWMRDGGRPTLGTTARVLIASEPIDLKSDGATTPSLRGEMKAGAPKVRMALEPKKDNKGGYDLVVELIYDTLPPTYPPVWLLSAEIGRPVADEGAPVLFQEFVRVRVAE